MVTLLLHNICDVIMGHVPEPADRQGFYYDAGGRARTKCRKHPRVAEASPTASGLEVGDSLPRGTYSSSSPRERKMSAVACSAFHGLCPEGTPSDVIISVDGIEFNAHEMVLSNCSAYFGALFSSNCSSANSNVYQIHGASPETIGLLIEYAYTGTVPLTEDNVESLLVVADQFNVLGIVSLCCHFLKAQLCSENCVGIWRFTHYYYCADLREAAHEFILHHFEEVTRVSAEFLELSFNDLQRLLEKGELPVREEAMLEAVLTWAAHDLPNRRQHIVFLLSKEGWRSGQKGFFFLK
ncbi:kelch-like protein 10 [Chroicocephalus ridibundus]|uniref:kelch-like protein 10 n=1 Tax=Chroicocephalus ridibundus TaxID=1192867 RepID=UPI002FDDEB1A